MINNKKIEIQVRNLQINGPYIYFVNNPLSFNISLISNSEQIDFLIDFDDGLQQNLTICDNFLILNHIYETTGIFNISIQSIGDDLFQTFNLTGKTFLNSFISSTVFNKELLRIIKLGTFN